MGHWGSKINHYWVKIRSNWGKFLVKMITRWYQNVKTIHQNSTEIGHIRLKIEVLRSFMLTHNKLRLNFNFNDYQKFHGLKQLHIFESKIDHYAAWGAQSIVRFFSNQLFRQWDGTVGQSYANVCIIMVIYDSSRVRKMNAKLFFWMCPE